MRQYFKLFSRVFLVAIFIIGLFILLFIKGFAPIYTSSISFDLKADELKNKSFKSLDVLAVGSSMTLYNLDSKTLLQGTGYSYYNFGSWSLSMEDIDLIMKNYVAKFKPKYVIICSNILDFRFKADKSYADYFKLEKMPVTKWKPAWYYFNYNSVFELLKRKQSVNKVTTGFDHDYYLKFDDRGSILLNVPKENLPEGFYQAQQEYPTPYTEQNFTALEDICKFSAQQKIKLIFVQSPIKSTYMNMAGQAQIIQGHINRCKAIVERQGGQYVNGFNTSIFTDSLFVDQFHLQQAGATMLTQQVVAARPFGGN